MPASAGEANMVTVDHHHDDEMASLSSLMQHKMVEKPKLLRPSAGSEECCIFRVPPDLVKINEEAYYPRVVSIGPYHHGEKHLQMLEEHKWRLLSSLLAQCEPHVNLQELIDEISFEEERIRESYSECIDKFSRSELVKMMILDGCFIIEFLMMVEGLVQCESDDPIVNIGCIATAIELDLFKLENQIPFFILEKLFQKTWASREVNTTLACLAKDFFNHGMQGPSHIENDYINRSNNQTASTKHLLDLYRTFLVMPISDTNPSTRDCGLDVLVMPITDTNPSTRDCGCGPCGVDCLESSKDCPLPDLPIVTHSTQMLRQAGIKFRRKESAKSFLEISFNKGIIEIPLLIIYDDTCTLLVNFIAFEQYYRHRPQVITSYAAFMDDLINSSVDSEYLQSKQIINSYIGTHEEVGRFFNQICRNITINRDECYLRAVCERINEYARNEWRAGWGGIKHKYFGAPWAWIAALGALLGLLLTATQTVFSVLGYVNPPK